MSEIDEGGAAFPSRDVHTDGRVFFNEGMTLRDYFAAKAMQGTWDEIPDDLPRAVALAEMAACAYEMADAMIAARNAAE